MSRTKVNPRTAVKIRQMMILFFVILFGIILALKASANTLESSSGKIHRNVSLRKVNKKYVNACESLKDKRNKKDKAKARKNKWR